MPLHTRGCSSQVVNVRGFRLLIDCAEGTQNKIRQQHLKLQGFEVICISHLHGDHFFGLPGLIATMHLCGRTTPLTIIGPKGIQEAVENINRYAGSHPNFAINFIEIDSNQCPEGDRLTVYENKKCRIYAIALRHTMPTYGYIVEEVPRYPEQQQQQYRYAYCCDTAPFDSLPDTLHDVNMLCIESTFAKDFEHIACEKLHCTAEQAATIAKQANAQKLLLSHFSARYKDCIQTVIDEAQSIYPTAIAAEDGGIYYVE